MILYPVTITVTSSNSPVENATISVWSDDVLVHKATAISSADGTALIGLPNGTYKIFINKEDYISAATAYTFTIADSPSELNYTLHTDSIVDIPAGKVLLYGYVKDITGNALLNAKVLCRLPQLDQYTSTTSYDKHDLTCYTNITGYYYFIIEGGLKVTLIIPTSNFMKVGVLPLSGRITGPELDQQATNL